MHDLRVSHEPHIVQFGPHSFIANGTDILVPVAAGGAWMMPDEGLDLYLGQFPKNDTRLSTTYAGLFTSQTATTVITHAQTQTNITETAYTGYARQSMAAATWGALSEYPTNAGRQTSYSQLTFGTVTASPGAALNGFFVNDSSGTGTGKCIAAANFSDGTAVPIQINDVVKLTPTMVLTH